LLSAPLNIAKFPADILTLENGLTVIHQHLAATSAVTIDVWVRAGAIAEPDEWSGMAHFLEHMIFKGTERLAPGVFDQIIESRGGMSNAATSHDYAHFFVTTAAQYLEDTLPHLAELLLHAAIPDEEFDRERDVVLEEIRGCCDDSDWIAFQSLTQSVYQCHPYGRSILGTEAQLRERSPMQMRSFHACHYQPENMTVVIVGGVEQDTALELAQQCFQDFPTPAACPQGIAHAEPPMTEIRRQELYLPRINQARLMMAWIGPGVEQLSDAYGLDLISALLAEGWTSRLVQDLREKQQLVQGVRSGFSLQRDSSLFTITAYLDSEQIEEVEARICNHLFELQTITVSPQELARCKRLLCNDYAFSTEAAGQLAGLYGYYNTIATAPVCVTYPQQIQQLQASDIMRIAHQYLSLQHYAVTVLKPA
jgi:zinc protease